MRTPRRLSLTLLLLTTLPTFAKQPCERLTQLKLDKTSIASAVVVPAGAFKVPAPTTIAAPSVDLGAYCRVEGIARPTADSEIKFEVWMPVSGWNGKYVQVGNGGFAGRIPTVAMTAPLARGYATAGTDDGHTGPEKPDARWAAGHPEKVIDFGYRAVHQTTLQAKAVIRAFYGKAPVRAYFDGCSDGGREALMEAQRFPKDFNGIIVGAPANYWTHHFAGFIWNEKALLDDPASAIPISKLAMVQRAALAACDSLDGVKDGLIEDPRECHFDLTTIQCQNADGPDCLSAPQVEALKKIYAGPRNPTTGEVIFPGYPPGDEASLWNWPFWITGLTTARDSAQAMFGNAFFGDMVFENPKWDFHAFDFDRDVATADQKMGSILNSNDPNLKPFKAHGGKLIQYHGWSDAAIAPVNSINYYERAAAIIAGKKQKNSLATLGDFYRLFMAPGVGHCGGGSGPGDFGDLALGSRLQPHDPDHDVLNALEQWVEDGKAPDKLIATKYSEKKVVMTRPLCPYPQIAHYKGLGDTNDAANFACLDSKETK